MVELLEVFLSLRKHLSLLCSNIAYNSSSEDLQKRLQELLSLIPTVQSPEPAEKQPVKKIKKIKITSSKSLKPSPIVYEDNPFIPLDIPYQPPPLYEDDECIVLQHPDEDHSILTDSETNPLENLSPDQIHRRIQLYLKGCQHEDDEYAQKAYEVSDFPPM